MALQICWLLLCGSTQASALEINADGWDHQVSLQGGARQWSDNTWGSLDVGWVFALRHNFRRNDPALSAEWPVALEWSYQLSGSENDGADLTVHEAQLGIMRTFWQARYTEASVSVGLHIAIAELEFERAGLDDREESVGGYARAQLMWRADRLRFGCALLCGGRRSRGRARTYACVHLCERERYEYSSSLDIYILYTGT